ncbi:MAG: hypothetical protein K6D96_02990 [Acetatifactor sp.]|nr:hypothetical protein [Acetatifactor sp.]
MSAAFEGTSSTSGLSVSSSINYSAAYASRKGSAAGYDFDGANDNFAEPVLTGNSNLSTFPAPADVEAAKTDTTGWKFDFYMEGIGNVTASSTGISYSSSDRDDDDLGRWWSWYENPTTHERFKSGIGYSASGDMAGLMSTLIGDKGLLSKTPSSGEAGKNDSLGSISINFSITSANNYSYGRGLSSNSIGSMSISFNVSQSDTQESVLNKIKDALNENTIVDFYKTGSTNDSVYMYYISPTSKLINAPVYGGVCNVPIQAGTEPGKYIDITYDALGIHQLGLADSEISSVLLAENAINEVKDALVIVSEERSVFGAYINRLEHAYNIDRNTEENTQASESKIRDTDMAKEMVAYSIANILNQAGQTMLANANQSADGVLALLQ